MSKSKSHLRAAPSKGASEGRAMRAGPPPMEAAPSPVMGPPPGGMEGPGGMAGPGGTGMPPPGGPGFPPGGGPPGGMKKGGKWIGKAIKHPGALHKQLGVPAGEKIPAKKLASAAEKGGTLGKRARLAETLKKMKH